MNVAKRGAWCSVPKCPTNVNKNAVCEFFSFPKKPQLAMQWVLKIGREDLLQKDPASGFPGLKICSMHFEEKVFANYTKTALKKNAIPTIFRRPLSLRQETKAQSRQSAEYHSQEPQIIISSPDSLTNESLTPPEDPLLLPSADDQFLIPEMIQEIDDDLVEVERNIVIPEIDEDVVEFERNIVIPEIDEDVMEVERNNVIQQTAQPQLAILWAVTRCVEKVEVASQTDDDEVLALRQQVQALQNQIRNLETGTNMGFPELIILARKLLPLHIAEFVEAQCSMGNRRADKKKYSTDFLKFASTLYALNPRTYAFMSTKFRLPTARLLQARPRR